MKTQNPLLIITMTASSAQTVNRFIGMDGEICVGGEKAAGVTQFSAAVDEQIGVATHGLLLVEAAGQIDLGTPIASDSQGRALMATGGQQVNGYALDDAIAGDVIRILRGI